MKKWLTFTTFLLILLLGISFIFPANAVSALEMDFSSQSILLMDYDTGEIIVSSNKHEKIYPASTTKIMTLLLALEAVNRGEVNLEDQVPVKENAAGMGGTQLFLSSGDVVDLESLLIGVTVGSANDASVAIAEYLAGSEGSFVDLMNERAQELGAKNTNFINSTGLHDEEHYTTAYDLSVMARELLKHPLFFQWSTIWMDENFLDGQIQAGKVYLSNTNRLIRAYKGCDGVKTGFTDAAGHSIVATAERNGTRFIATVLGAPSSEDRYEEASRLLNYGFNNFKSVHVANRNEIVATLPVEKGSLQGVDVVTEGKLSLLIKKDEEADYEIEYDFPEKLQPPVFIDESIGEMKVVREGEVEGSVNLIPVKDVKRASFSELYFRYFKNWLRFGR